MHSHHGLVTICVYNSCLEAKLAIPDSKTFLPYQLSNYDHMHVTNQVGSWGLEQFCPVLCGQC